MLTAVSLYSGGGGIDEGLKQAGVKTIYAIDNGIAECDTLKENFPDCEVICDRVDKHLSILPKADIVVGGPPCPEFSRAKMGRTFDMCEVNNFWRAVDLIKPKWYLMENVQDIKKKLIKHNFKINMADYGVPQTRVRRFFTNIPLPPPTHAENPQQNLLGQKINKWVSVKEALNLDGIIQDRKTTFQDGFRNYSIDKPSFTLLADARVWYISNTRFKGSNQIEKTRTVDNPAMTVMASEEMQLTDYKIYSTKYLKEKNPIIYKKHPLNTLGKPASTICAKDRGTQGDGMISNGEHARKLTLGEIAILQGFPETYKFVGTKTEVRRQIGNAVPPSVIKVFFTQEDLRQ